MAEPVTLTELRSRLSQPEIEDPFGTVRAVAFFATRDSFGPQSQELILRLLEKRESVRALRGAVDSLARRFGLFPYIADSASLSLGEALAVEMHRVHLLRERTDRTVVFHREQAAIFHALMRGENVILSAPTSFGKSLIIDAVLAACDFKNVVVVLPTLALIDETRRRLATFRNRYRIITHGSQQLGERNIFIVTQERLLERLPADEIDFFVIDEFYKLSPGFEAAADDDGRALLLNHALYVLARSGAQFYMLGPSIQSIPLGAQKKLEARFIVTSYATVVSETVIVPSGSSDEARLLSLAPSLTDPTLVYCRSPRRASEVAAWLGSVSAKDVDQEVRVLCSWLRDEYHPEWSFIDALEHGVGTHHGQLPRALGQLVVRNFNEGRLRFLVCTSTLIEGVNTCAKNVVLVDATIGRRGLDYFTFNNIRGRSGRMFQHFVGRVFLFHPAPQIDLPPVDLPVFTQPETTPPSLLIQLEDVDLTDRSRQRLEPYRAQNVLSEEVLRANLGVDLDQQIRAAEEIDAAPRVFSSFGGWTNTPTYEQLVEMLGFLQRFPLGVRSGPRLSDKAAATLIDKFRRRVPLREIIAQQLKYVDNNPDRAVLDTLAFIRNFMGFGLPRSLRALDRIQTEILARHGMAPGQYEGYCRRLENAFLPGKLLSLEEFGVPLPLAVKLARHFTRDDDLDSTLDTLRRLDAASVRGLTALERALLRDAQDGL